MRERDLIRICIAGSVLSLIALFIFVNNIQPTGVNIGEITREHLGTVVNIEGTVKDLSTSEGNVFFTLEDGTGEIRVVVWKSLMDSMASDDSGVSVISENVSAKIEGEVQYYRGYLEIIANKFEAVKNS